MVSGSSLALAALATSIVTTFLPNSRTRTVITAAAVGLSLILALVSSIISVHALGISILATVMAIATTYLIRPYFRYPLGLATVLALLIMATHQAPGFSNPVLLDAVTVSVNSQAFTLSASYDKAIVGLILLWCWGNSTQLNRQPSLKVTTQLGYAGIGAIILLSAGYISGLDFDFKWYTFTPIFLTVNLLFTVVAEEAFFRATLQRLLVEKLKNSPAGAAVAVGITAIAFALAHFGGGWLFMGLAFIAGVIYGLVYLRTGNLIMSILCHWLVNACHFIFFTYPI